MKIWYKSQSTFTYQFQKLSKRKTTHCHVYLNIRFPTVVKLREKKIDLGAGLLTELTLSLHKQDWQVDARLFASSMWIVYKLKIKLRGEK